MLKNIVFDFDGVIADTFDMIFANMLEHHPETSFEDFVAHHDGNVHEEPVIQMTSEAEAGVLRQYTERISPSHLKASIDPIKRLATRYRLFIISSNEEAGIHAVLQTTDLTDCFEVAMGYNTHTSKVEKFKMIRDNYGVDFKETVFVTDTLGDIKEAKKLGITTIAETFGFHPKERLAQGEPYVIVDSWEEIESEIEKLSIES